MARRVEERNGKVYMPDFWFAFKSDICNVYLALVFIFRF